MSKIIDVPGIGVVGFPDSMTDAEIAAAIRQGLGKAVSRGGSPYEYQISDEFEYRQTTGVPMGQAWEEQQVRYRTEENERRTKELLFGTLLVIALIAVGAWGWVFRTKLVSIVRRWTVAEAIEWAKLALIIAVTVLVLRLIYHEPWRWFLRH